MAEKQDTTMVIKVDLGCEKCHKKIKKVLCKIPEIQNQMYDKKANTVTITVACCCPEKIKKKIRCKGGEAVKGIEIKVPKETTGKTKGEGKKKEEGKTKEEEKPPPPPPDRSPKPGHVPGYPIVPVYPKTCCSECYQGFGGGPCYHGYGRPTPQSYVPYGTPVYDSWGGGSCNCQSRGYYVCRCEYVYRNNPSSCTIM